MLVSTQRGENKEISCKNVFSTTNWASAVFAIPNPLYFFVYLYSNLLFLGFSHSIFFLLSSPFSFLFLSTVASDLLVCYFSHYVFHFLLFLMLHWEALENPSPSEDWSFGLCWLSCQQCSEVLVETSGVAKPNFSRWSPVPGQLSWGGWSSCAEKLRFSKACALPCIIQANILT